MKTLTLFEAYVKAIDKADHARTWHVFQNSLRQSKAFEVAIRARLESSTRHIELTGRAQESLARYRDAHAESKALATDADVTRWREECRSYAAQFAYSVLISNPRLREVQP